MKFSIIIPLEDHRDHAVKCLTSWCRDLAYAPEHYEVVCVAPPTYPKSGRQALAALLRPHDQWIDTDATHDIIHLGIGAAAARSDILFFTESHAWPDPDMLQRCDTAFERHPDWSAFSGGTYPITSNRLGQVEADMHEANAAYGMTVSAWRRIFDPCFVTRRSAYLEAGGFDPGLGHFAEWALAARYYDHGFTIGYAPDVRIRHFYSGDLPGMTWFANDFIDGEIRHLARIRALGAASVIEEPYEWTIRDRWNSRLARALAAVVAADLRQQLRSGKPGPEAGSQVRELIALSRAALWGTRYRRVAAFLAIVRTRIVLAVAQRFARRPTLGRAFEGYIGAVIQSRRLRRIFETISETAGTPLAPALCLGDRNAADRITGFHATIERSDGMAFRWSRPVAMVECAMAAGAQRLIIRCLPGHIARARPRFFLDGKPLAPHQIVLSETSATLSVAVPRAGVAQLAWVCGRFRAPRDRRRLGLPVIDVTVEPAAQPTAVLSAA